VDEDTARYEFEFEITLDDLVDFLRLDQKVLNATGAIGGLAMIAVGVVFIVGSGDLIFGLLSMLLGLGWIGLSHTRHFDRWRTGRQARAIIGRKVRLSVGKTGIEVTSNETETKVDWSGATGVKDDERMVIVARQRRPALWIPTRAFASADQRAEAIAYMRERTVEARAAATRR